MNIKKQKELIKFWSKKLGLPEYYLAIFRIEGNKYEVRKYESEFKEKNTDKWITVKEVSA